MRTPLSKDVSCEWGCFRSSSESECHNASPIQHLRSSIPDVASPTQRPQGLAKKLQMGSSGKVLSMDVHPSGDHVVVGMSDGRASWFDLDLSSTPYRTLRHHQLPVTSVAYHPRYPLFATASGETRALQLIKRPLVQPRWFPPSPWLLCRPCESEGEVEGDTARSAPLSLDRSMDLLIY